MTFSFRYQMHRYKQALDMFGQAEKLMQRVDHEVYYYIGKRPFWILTLLSSRLIHARVWFSGDLLYRNAQQQQQQQNTDPKATKANSKEYKDYFKQVTWRVLDCWSKFTKKFLLHSRQSWMASTEKVIWSWLKSMQRRRTIQRQLKCTKIVYSKSLFHSNEPF